MWTCGRFTLFRPDCRLIISMLQSLGRRPNSLETKTEADFSKLDQGDPYVYARMLLPL